MPVFGKIRRRARRKPAAVSHSDMSNDLELVTPDKAPGSMDAGSLLGVLPEEQDCLIFQNLLKLNHLYEWRPRIVALTEFELCFACEGESHLRDSIPLHEVFEILFVIRVM
jgi:hypothetical protein